MKKPKAKAPAEVAAKLAEIYEQGFGGKDRGRYQISREGLREISGKKRLEDSIINGWKATPAAIAKPMRIGAMQDPARFSYQRAFMCFHLRRKYRVNSPD
jgi:hypothetical protein